jgi:ferredoxin
MEQQQSASAEDQIAVVVTVNADTCMASGNCSFWAPHVFELPDEGDVTVVRDPAGDPIEKILGAAKGCPTQSIRVFVDGDRLH